MSFTLSDFADKIRNAPDDHLVQVKTTQDGTPEIAIVAATSAQTFGQHSVSVIEFAPATSAGEGNVSSAPPQDPNALAQATLLKAIARYYCVHTSVEPQIQEQYSLARFAAPDSNQIVPPDLAPGENVKPLTCREVEQILKTATGLAPQTKSLGQAPMELLQQVISSLGNEKLSSAILVNRAWCKVAVPQHAIAKAERIALLPMEQRTNRFVDLFRFFTGEDLDNTIGKKPLEPFLVGPDKTSKAAGLTSLAAQLTKLTSEVQAPYFKAILKHGVSLPADVSCEPMVALTKKIQLIPRSERSEVYNQIHAQAAKMAPSGCAQVLAALAEQIRFLPDLEGKKAFDALFATAQSMEDAHGGQILGGLASQIENLPQQIQQPYFDKMFIAIEARAPEHQSAGWAGLASQLHLVEPSQMIACFDKLLEAVISLPEKDRKLAIGALTQEFRKLVENGHLDSGDATKYFDKLFNANLQVDFAYQSEGWKGLLSVARKFGTEEEGYARIDKIFAANALAPSEFQVQTLKDISDVVMFMPLEKKRSYHSRLFEAMNKLSPDERADTKKHLNKIVDSIVAESESFPDPERPTFRRKLGPSRKNPS